MGSSNWKASQDDCVAGRMSWAWGSTGKAAGRVAASLGMSGQHLQHPNAEGWHFKHTAVNSQPRWQCWSTALISQVLQWAELLRQCSFLPLSCSSVKPDLKDKTNHLRQHCCKSRGINCHPEPSSCSWPLKLHLLFSFLWFALWVAVVIGISFAEKACHAHLCSVMDSKGKI